MGETFKNPPLLEIIAELRWAAPSMPSPPIPMPVVPQASGPFDEAFMRFAAKVGALGYERVERLVPYGFPMMPYDPVVRLRPKTGVEDSTLYQIGAYMFSANAIPPYKSWDDFAPKVREGVRVLLESRVEKDAKAPVLVSLRYLDAFREDLTDGKPLVSFLAEAFGITLGLPAAIQSQCAEGKVITPAIQMSVPIGFGTMNLSIAEGEVDKQPAVIMDTSVSFAEATPPEVDQIMEGFGKAREVIHDVFVGLTQSLADRMKAEGVKA
ncbi:MAG: hypothetical protein B7Z35_09400 [Hydrogenophilales bacterium 12-61-10]|nr:MAG: hypothetical protein B7Z35_09400 [Hydrogenophilales bacterium 12-61-10]OYX29188.1 MAG: hypothetical protein B7Z03_09715 [Hydrogenophilales bacterium 32-62-9]